MATNDSELQRGGTTSVNKWYNKWQRMTASDNECYNEWQKVTMSDTTSDNKWQQMTMSDNEWQQWYNDENGTVHFKEWMIAVLSMTKTDTLLLQGMDGCN